MRCVKGICLGLLFVVMAAGEARADSHGWWGTLGPVKVNVWRYGFAEGAGTGGWDTGGVLWFAEWAARLRASLPPGIGVDIDQGSDDAYTVTLLRCRVSDRGCARPLSRKLLFTSSSWEEEVDLDARFARRILRIVGRAIGRDLPLHGKVRQPPLYTIQLLASRSEKRAIEFSVRVDGIYEHGAPYVYDQNCGPCYAPPETKHDGGTLEGLPIHRVIVGNYESPALARSDLAALAKVGIQGYIRPLARQRGARANSWMLESLEYNRGRAGR
jgi:hypothetical protein